VKRRKDGVGDAGRFNEELCSQFWTVRGSWVKNSNGRRGVGTECSERKENNFAKNSPIFFPAWLQHLAQQFKQLEDGGNISLRNDGAFKHDTVQKPKMVAKF